MSYLSSNNTQITSVPLSLDEASKLITERAKDLINRLIVERGHDRPPFAAQEYARLLGIRVNKFGLGEVSAVLLSFQDDRVIKVNENHSRGRQNFSCAHEIGHILFEELELWRFIDSIEYRRTYNPQVTHEMRAWAKEKLCDIAATELIMPESVFRKYLSLFGPSLGSVELLAKTFQVSITAAARRVAETSVEPCVVLVWKLDRGSKSKTLRLAWKAGPRREMRNKDTFTPLHRQVSCLSTLHKAYEYDKTVKCHKLFKLDTDVKRLPMESKGFGYGENRTVISLAFLDRIK